MSDRVPDPPLDHILDRHHRAVRRALVIRHGLRGAAAACALVVLAVVVGVTLPLGPGAAWARLLLTLAGVALAIAAAVRAFRSAMPGFDAWQEGIERRFPELRSWLRNAFELQAAPPADTSPALARALTAETARRLKD